MACLGLVAWVLLAGVGLLTPARTADVAVVLGNDDGKQS